jgi:short-subunit dehydrogenase
MKPQIVLITGATAGIGRRTALDLARAGHRVFATGRRVDALTKLKEEAKGLSLEVLTLDVTKQSSIDAAKAALMEATEGQPVDVLINNAGYGLVGPLEDISDAQLRAQYETNVFGLMAMTRAFLPEMRERGSGKIINVSSMGGKVTFPFMGAYNSTKYAIESMSDALRVELRPFGVHVVLIEPGAIHTEFADVALGGATASPDSPWASAIADAEEMRKKFDSTAVGPEHVSRAIARAINATRPSARYVAPRRTYFALWAFRVIPTRIMDALLAAASGLTKKKLFASKKSTPLLAPTS